MLNTLFTIGPARRYPGDMVLVALAAISLAAPAPKVSQRPVLQQATATVRIVLGERISAADLPRDALVRDAWIKAADGQTQQVRLVEFP
jgi:hypothetical protein